MSEETRVAYDLSGKAIAFVLIKTELDKTEDVFNQVLRIPAVQWAAKTVGPYDIIAAVEVADLGELNPVWFGGTLHGLTIPGIRGMTYLNGPEMAVATKAAGYGHKTFP